jgi:hypothetical protein
LLQEKAIIPFFEVPNKISESASESEAMMLHGISVIAAILAATLLQL